jgi:RimJ/RimL family protein N-acetyltransferase
MGAMAAPPERIELPDVDAVMRRHRLDDLELLQQAIEESRDHLRPWMIWADQGRDDTVTFLHGAREKWDAGDEFSYLIVGADGGRVVGGGGLHRRAGPETLEIGYWLRAGETGRGVITAAARALTGAAFALDGIERVEIHCDEANVRSAAVPRRLGYALAEIRDKPAGAPGERGREMIWVRTISDGSPVPGQKEPR